MPVPTRPLYEHKYRCTQVIDLNSSLIPVYQDIGSYSGDLVWNVSVGMPKRVHEVNRTDCEFGPDHELRVSRFTPDEGNDYLVILVHVQNIGSEEFCFDISRFTLTNNQTEIPYAIDEVMDFLYGPFSGGRIAPLEELSGSIAYQVPAESEIFNLSVQLEDIRVIYALELPGTQG